MKTLPLMALVLLLLPASAHAQEQWNEGVTIGVPRSAPGGLAVYVVGTGADSAANRPHVALGHNAWHSIDLADPSYPVDLNIPYDAKAVFLMGVLITSGLPNVNCSIMVTFRTPGDVSANPENYTVAAASALPGGAYRQDVAMWVPVVNRHFDFYWRYMDPDCPMIISLRVQAYVR